MLEPKQVKKTPVCKDCAHENAPDHIHHKQVVDIYGEQPSKNLGNKRETLWVRCFATQNFYLLSRHRDLLTLQGVRNQTAGGKRETLVFWKGAVFPN